jgi:molecular chaperone DnaJ
MSARAVRRRDDDLTVYSTSRGPEKFRGRPSRSVALAGPRLRDTKRDYYEVLGVPETADADQIRQAFRRLARELHPDVSTSPGADEDFRDVSAAYNVLSQPRSRFLYDHFGYRSRGSRLENGRLGPPRVLGFVVLDAFEAARGAGREVKIADEDVCAACDGSGSAPGSEIEVCGTCAGKGTVRVSAGLGIGRWLKVEPCPACEGEGRFQVPCPNCRGRGELRRERTIKVRVPARVENGTRLRVAGEDENAYLVVRITPLPRDSLGVRLFALVLLACAVALLAYFVAWA